MPSCGEVQTSQQCNRASRFSGHLLGTTITCRTNWKGLPMSTNASWPCCLQCRTSRVGCFLCIAHQPGRTIWCALCTQTVCGVLLKHTTVCTLLNIPTHQDQSTRDTPFHCLWEDWVFGVPSAPALQVGRLLANDQRSS